MPDATAKKIATLFDRLKSDRGRWEGLWRNVGRFSSPARHVDRGIINIPVDRSRLYDNTAVEAAFELASVLHGILTSPASDWFALDVDSTQKDALLWADQVRLLLMKLFRDPRTGFNSAMSELYIDHVTFGTACQSLLEDTVAVARFRSHPIGECYLAENEAGAVDTVVRRFDFTAEQAASMWGVDSLALDARKDFTDIDKRFSRKRAYLHAVLPNDERNPALPMVRTNMPFASVYLDLKAERVVDAGGFRTFPYLTPRWSKTPGEVYGQSPAINVLEEVMMANSMRRSHIIVMEKAADPPLQVEDNTVLAPPRTRPGGLTYRRRGTEPVTPLPVGDPRIGERDLEESRGFIRKSFLLDKINLPLQDRMTATEVIERRRDALQVLSPFVSRMQEEHLSPMVTRVLGIMSRRGLLPPVPDSVTRAEVRYVSPLAVSQRAGEVQSVQAWLGIMGPLAQIDEGVLMAVNTDELAQGTGVSLNVPQRYINAPETVARRRAELEQQQQALAVAQAAPGIADAAKTAVETQQLLPAS